MESLSQLDAYDVSMRYDNEPVSNFSCRPLVHAKPCGNVVLELTLTDEQTRTRRRVLLTGVLVEDEDDTDLCRGDTDTAVRFDDVGAAAGQMLPALPALVRESEELSPRETAVLERLTQGDSNKHIARRLGIAEPTVKCHVKSILRKIGARNRFEAAMWGLRRSGELQLPALRA